MTTGQMIGLALAVAAAVAAVWWFLLGSRRRQLRKLGANLGLRFEPNPEAVAASGLLSSGLFRSDNARCENLLRGQVRGTDDGGAFVFDYRRPGAQPDPVTLFRLPSSRLPSFELRPRLSSSDPPGLALEGGSRFSEIYALKAEDEAAVRGLFRGEVLTFFERSENQDWAVVSSGEWLGVTVWPHGKRSRRLEPKQVMGFVEDAKQVLFLLVEA